MLQKFRNPQKADINIFLANINFIFRHKFIPMPSTFPTVKAFCTLRDSSLVNFKPINLGVVLRDVAMIKLRVHLWIHAKFDGNYSKFKFCREIFLGWLYINGYCSDHLYSRYFNFWSIHCIIDSVLISFIVNIYSIFHYIKIFVLIAHFIIIDRFFLLVYHIGSGGQDICD